MGMMPVWGPKDNLYGSALSSHQTGSGTSLGSLSVFTPSHPTANSWQASGVLKTELKDVKSNALKNGDFGLPSSELNFPGK